MNINAKQLATLDLTRMDITTLLGFFLQIKNQIITDTTLTGTLGTVWTNFLSSLTAFDESYAQARKWLQTADIENLDKQRDSSLSGYLNALKAMTASPNATKQQAAKYLWFIREKYSLSINHEYMKETTAISQMIEEIESDAQATTALATTALDDWLTDLKTKNQAFLNKMNERTEAQAGLQKGIVREKRLACEAAYRDLLKLLNALAIVEVPAGYNYTTIIDRLNAEIEHYRQILARKGSGSSSGSGGGGVPDSGGGDSGGSDQGGGDQGGGSDQGGGDQGGGDQGGGDDSGGGDSGGGDSGGGDSGGGDEPYEPTPGGGQD